MAANAHFADRLTASIRAKGNSLCVGLDPRWDRLPVEFRRRHADGTLAGVARAYEEFCGRVIDVVAPLVAVVKAQSAFFEACGPPGMTALQATLRRARERGLISIWDGKRNDIADTAVAYADAAFAGPALDGERRPVLQADALTVNPYLGRDSLEPFLEAARVSGGGVFILVRTSNPGARQFQDLDCGGRPLFQHVAEGVAACADEHRGDSGFSLVGAVIGATYPAELATLRASLRDVYFLVPGFGAQGAQAADTAGAFRADGLGAIVNSSRGILYSCSPDELDWERAVESATRSTIRALSESTPMGHLARSRKK